MNAKKNIFCRLVHLQKGHRYIISNYLSEHYNESHMDYLYFQVASGYAILKISIAFKVPLVSIENY